MVITPSVSSGVVWLIRGAKRRLEASEREVLLLLVVEGFEPVRAAAILEIAHPALPKRLSRARAYFELLQADTKRAWKGGDRPRAVAA
jgi:DNA-directed RNA polymerase specialized sigma24 family protein